MESSCSKLINSFTQIIQFIYVYVYVYMYWERLFGNKGE